MSSRDKTHYVDVKGDPLKPFPKQAEALRVPFAQNRRRVLLITGLPGSGKTEIAKSMAQRLGAVHINADTVRSTINEGLDFSEASRIKQAKTLGYMARIVADSGVTAVVDFVCPILSTRLAVLSVLGMHRPYTTWVEVHRPKLKSRFEDTSKMYVPLQQDVPELNLYPGALKTIVNEEGKEEETKNAVMAFYWTCAHV